MHFQRESGWCELSLHSAEGRPGAPVVKRLIFYLMCNFRRLACVTGPGDMNSFCDSLSLLSAAFMRNSGGTAVVLSP